MKYEAIEILSDALPVPELLGYWEGNDEIQGALVLSEIKGQPVSGNVDEILAYDIWNSPCKVAQCASARKQFI